MKKLKIAILCKERYGLKIQLRRKECFIVTVNCIRIVKYFGTVNYSTSLVLIVQTFPRFPIGQTFYLLLGLIGRRILALTDQYALYLYTYWLCTYLAVYTVPIHILVMYLPSSMHCTYIHIGYVLT